MTNSYLEDKLEALVQAQMAQMAQQKTVEVVSDIGVTHVTDLKSMYAGCEQAATPPSFGQISALNFLDWWRR